MHRRNRREFLGDAARLAAAAAVLPSSIRCALDVPASRRSGTLEDVEHIVILTQENRSFDHYFGTLPGVRGFADPFPIPVPDRDAIRGRSVWFQPTAGGAPPLPALVPFRLDTAQQFEYIRVEGTPHSWTDAQRAWNDGRLDQWPLAKGNHAMGYYGEEDIPFQWALANAFTICDAYHCSAQTGTNPNRLFIFTGTNDGLARGNGPALYNDYDWFDADPGQRGGYAWTTYAERLEQAGISWQVYENMDDNFTDNPLAGFVTFRDAWFRRPGFSEALRARGASTRDLDLLRADVIAGQLPQVSWVVATAEGSEHPSTSSPAQGADYTARVLDALTANPAVWSKTVLLINFDENDGFFDHMPPPAPPSGDAGASTVDTAGEYHEHLPAYHDRPEERALLHKPYGLGPRVPLYVVSPWSKGGWVCSEVFDHTSILRFVESRFGVREPNISAWRRAVCGDLTAAFDFARPDRQPASLPATLARAKRARALSERATPPTPTAIDLPAQEGGLRPSRALPYELHVDSAAADGVVALEFGNTGRAGAVFHVYDRLNLKAVPRRYTVEAGKSLRGVWDAADDYDLWVLGPNGFHRRFTGTARSAAPEAGVRYAAGAPALRLMLDNSGLESVTFEIAANRYDAARSSHEVAPGNALELYWPLVNGPWYDISVTVKGLAIFTRRFAGRMESGAHSVSDPAMEGGARVAAD